MSVRVGESDVVGKSGKKSKTSKKVDVDGVEEVSDRVDVEDGIGRSGNKGKRRKKKEMDGVEEVTDRMDAEDGFGKSGKKGKKSKKKEMDGVEEMNDQTDVENEQNLVSRVEKKKKKKKANDIVAGGESLTDTEDKENTVEKQKKKKKKTKIRIFETCENQDALTEKTETEAKESNSVAGNGEKKKKKRKRNGEKKKNKRKRTVEEEDDKNSARGEDVGNSLPDDDGMVAVEKVKIKKKKKRKNEEITEKDGLSCKAKDDETINVSKKKTKSVDKDPENLKSKEKKKVRFSEDVEVFPLPDTKSSGNDKGGLVQGKRFTQEEDEILKAAVEKYIQSHCLGEKGVEMVMNCKSHRQIRKCWNEIGEALPHRPRRAIYYRAHTLFERGKRFEWTEEEREKLLEMYKKHGNNWKLMAEEFKRHRRHVKDTYRRIKMQRNKGHWSREEYQSLFDHVSVDLRAKLDDEKKSKHGMLRDNIRWTAISDRLSTRADALCCMKWYDQLTSPMVAQGVWADSDDYRLLDALFNLDACCIEDVDWDDLIDQRSGDVCRKRWDQMVLHIGLNGVKPFAEQVEVLAKRYRPELLEAREAWDSKPLVP